MKDNILKSKFNTLNLTFVSVLKLLLFNLFLSLPITIFLNFILLQIGFFSDEVFPLSFLLYPIQFISLMIFSVLYSSKESLLVEQSKSIIRYFVGFHLVLYAWYNHYENFVSLEILPSGWDSLIWSLGYIISVFLGLFFTNIRIHDFIDETKTSMLIRGYCITYNLLVFPFLFFVERQTQTTNLLKFSIIVGIVFSIIIGFFAVVGSKLLDTQRKLRESEKSYRFIFERAPIGIGTSDMEGNVLFSNHRIAEILGYTLEELKTVDLKETFADPDFRNKTLEELIEKRELSNLEVLRKRKDGSLCYTLTNLQIIEINNKPFILNSTLDITDRKKIQEELKKKEEQLELALWGAEEGLWDWDLKFGQVKYSQLWKTLYGWSSDEIDGDLSLWENIVHPEDLDKVKRIILDFKNDKMPFYEAEHRIKTKSGKWRWILDRGKIVERDENGNPVRAVGITQDITNRKIVEKEKEKLEEQRKQYIQSISHELITPIMNILMVIEFLEKIDTKKFVEERTTLFKIMNNSLHRLERLVLDLSNVSRIERGIFSLKKKIIDFNQFINNEILSYSKLLGDEIEFNLSDVSETVFIEIDKERIGQVLANVIDNATKNTYPETRKIKFSTLIEKDFVKISIEDNGAGIKLKHLKKIFGQFVTIPTKYSDKGSGIGLYLSKVIIEGHGGQITAYSEGLEKGTRIEIILPKIEIEK